MNLRFWWHIYSNSGLNGFSDFLFTLGLGPVFIGAHLVFNSLFSWPYIGKPLLIILILLSSLSSINYFLSKTIDIIDSFSQLDSALLYVSDHGESLGEGGGYMHAAPFDTAPKEQLMVPLIIWMSGNLRRAKDLDYDCLKTSADLPLSHDHIFHSVLGFMDIQSRVYSPELDIFKPCRRETPKGAGLQAENSPM